MSNPYSSNQPSPNQSSTESLTKILQILFTVLGPGGALKVLSIDPAKIIWGAITGTITDQTDLVSYISAQIATALSTTLKNRGPLDCSTNPNYPAAAANDFFLVSASGKVGGASGLDVYNGDWVVCLTSNAGGTQAAVGADWYVIQAELTPATILGTVLTGLNTTAGTVTASDTILSAIGKLVGNVVAISGTGYITLGTVLTGFSAATATVVTAADSILVAFGKLQGQINTITSAGYQTAAQVTTAITSYGYQTAAQVATAITSYGYQTAAQVTTAITSYGYQTAAQVNTAISTAISGLSSVYAAIASPTFTGTPAAPTATAGTNTTQIATTAFVQAAVAAISGVLSTVLTGLSTATATAITATDTVLQAFGKLQGQLNALSSTYAPIASPTFTGTVAAPTPSYGDSSTKVATTAFIAGAGYNGINAQSGTTYTLVLSDANKLVTLNNASPITLTIPTNASVAFTAGQIIDISQIGAGRVTVAGAGGVTVNSSTGLITSVQYSSATLIFLGSNTWLLVGNTATS